MALQPERDYYTRPVSIERHASLAAHASPVNIVLDHQVTRKSECDKLRDEIQRLQGENLLQKSRIVDLERQITELETGPVLGNRDLYK